MTRERVLNASNRPSWVAEAIYIKRFNCQQQTIFGGRGSEAWFDLCAGQRWVNNRGGRSQYFRLDSAPVPNFGNPDPEVFQIWESDTCSDSGYYRSNWQFTPVFAQEMTTRTPTTAKIEKWLRIRKKNAESCRSRVRHSGSVTTSGQLLV